MASSQRQRDWILSCMVETPIKRKKAESTRRSKTMEYYIPYNNQKVKVCQQFLIKTLNVSQMTLRYTKENALMNNIAKQDQRGKRSPKNKFLSSQVSLVKEYIKQLPAVPSHYCRNKSNKLYLPAEFENVTNLYRLYKKYLVDSERLTEIVSLSKFRKIFRSDFHIGFHLPKKDKCNVCEKIKYLPSIKQEEEKKTESFNQHIKDKERCLEIFLKDQNLSKEGSVLCVSFDLEKVLNTPHGESVNLFYCRKYAFYNETFYESGSANVYWYLWGESDAKRGCNEICTIVYMYLKKKDLEATHETIYLYCDSCSRQNRNKPMLAMLSYFIERSEFIKNIKITFLLPGHTMMPVDSVHSSIELFSRRKTVWSPKEWPTIIRNSRTNPFNYVTESLNFSNFLNWKDFAETLIPNKFKINISKLRIAMFNKDNPQSFILKYGFFDNSELKTINLQETLRTRRN
uniref:Uncharacterized protein LOC114347251 n=1 Tax=Diabrotica virgifera virgifera TaxID=50390 RepID=A0A6P7GVK6_DIAVI